MFVSEAADGKPPDTAFVVFMVAWLLLGAGSAAFFWLSKDVELKKWLHPRLTIAAAVLFGGFTIWWMGWWPAPIMVPALVLITWLNIRNTRWCPGCGRMIMNQAFFIRAEFCQKCGARLDGREVKDIGEIR